MPPHSSVKEDFVAMNFFRLVASRPHPPVATAPRTLKQPKIRPRFTRRSRQAALPTQWRIFGCGINFEDFVVLQKCCLFLFCEALQCGQVFMVGVCCIVKF